jgi:hypothetical protein
MRKGGRHEERAGRPGARAPWRGPFGAARAASATAPGVCQRSLSGSIHPPRRPGSACPAVARRAPPCAGVLPLLQATALRLAALRQQAGGRAASPSPAAAAGAASESGGAVSSNGRRGCWPRSAQEGVRPEPSVDAEPLMAGSASGASSSFPAVAAALAGNLKGAHWRSRRSRTSGSRAVGALLAASAATDYVCCAWTRSPPRDAWRFNGCIWTELASESGMSRGPGARPRTWRSNGSEPRRSCRFSFITQFAPRPAVYVGRALPVVKPPEPGRAHPVQPKR